MPLPSPKYARVDQFNPEGWGQCEHCGFWRNRSDLVWQYEWAGMHLYNKSILVCRDRCYDTPQEQFRTIILPPDPPPLPNVRVPQLASAEYIPIQFQFGTSNTIPSDLPPWGGGTMFEMMTQDHTEFLSFQYFPETDANSTISAPLLITINGSPLLIDPSISMVTPSAAITGTLITISGNNFNSATTMYINNKPATFTIVSNITITATVP